MSSDDNTSLGGSLQLTVYDKHHFTDKLIYELNDT